MIQSPRHLFVFVFLCEKVNCWSRVNCPSPSGDSALLGPAQLSFLVRRLQAREFFSILSFRLTPTMMFDHLLHQCCWPTCVDSSLRCALALRSRSGIGFHSCLCPCPLCPCHCVNQVCCPWCPSCRLSCLPLLSCRSAIHQLLSHDAMFLIHSVSSCLLPCWPCILSKQWRTRLHETCRCSWCNNQPTGDSQVMAKVAER